MDKNYSVKIVESLKDLTPKERISLKDTQNCLGLDEASKICTENGEKLILSVENYVVLDIHNEKADNKDYRTLVVVDKEGNKFSTSSTSFYNQFTSIMEELAEAEITEDIYIEVVRRESKNYKGKEFITCALV